MLGLVRRSSLAPNTALPMLLISFACLVPVQLAAQAAAAKQGTYKPARVADGKPDFSGFWSYNTATPLVRPDRFQSREFLRPDEVEAVEKSRHRMDEDRVKGAPCVVFITNSNCCVCRWT